MGIALDKLQSLGDAGILTKNSRVLDIGTSNLYSATIPALARFAAQLGGELADETARSMAERSTYGEGITRNEMFVGELFDALGIEYSSIDIAEGYRTVVFDLNTETLPKGMPGRFDLVMNFGTTEHVLNQFNAMTVIHDACAVGGHMIHELPALGYLDHGYFAYTPRFFFDLAGYNGYEIVAFKYRRGGAGNPVNDIVRAYSRYFPMLAEAAENSGSDDFAPPVMGISIVYRKMTGTPFVIPGEFSTSVILKPGGRTGTKALPGMDRVPAGSQLTPWSLTSSTVGRVTRVLSRYLGRRSGPTNPA